MKVLNDPEVKAALAKHGLDPAPGTREELARYMARESDTWGAVVRRAKITADSKSGVDPGSNPTMRDPVSAISPARD